MISGYFFPIPAQNNFAPPPDPVLSTIGVLNLVVLPNCSTEIFVQALLIATRAIIIESSLSFLGLGIPPPSPSWGSMLSIGRSYLYRMVWYGIMPGIFIMMLSLIHI